MFLFFISSKSLPLTTLRGSMIIVIAERALHRALRSTKILTFIGHLLLIIALSENEGLSSTFSIRRMKTRVVTMMCKC